MKRCAGHFSGSWKEIMRSLYVFRLPNSESVSAHLNFFGIKNLRHNRSFVISHNVKRYQIACGPGAEGCVSPA